MRACIRHFDGRNDRAGVCAAILAASLVADSGLHCGGRAHREQIARELIAIYRPRCNIQQYDQAWKDHWIGEYSAPTTGPLASRGPDDPPPGEPAPRALGADVAVGLQLCPDGQRVGIRCARPS